MSKMKIFNKALINDKDFKKTKEVLEQMDSAELVHQDKNGNTIGHILITNKGSALLPDFFLKMDKKHISAQNKEGDTILHLAINAGLSHTAMVEIMKAMEPEAVSLENNKGESAIFLAATKHDDKTVEKLFPYYKSNQPNYENALTKATLESKIIEAQNVAFNILLKKMNDQWIESVVFKAYSDNNLSLMKALFESKPNLVGLKDKNNNTMLELTFEKSMKEKTGEIKLDQENSISVKMLNLLFDNMNKYPLTFQLFKAVQENKVDLLKYLFSKNSNFANLINDNTVSLFSVAVSTGWADICEIFLPHLSQAIMIEKDSVGRSPLHLATDAAIRKMIIEKLTPESLKKLLYPLADNSRDLIIENILRNEIKLLKENTGQKEDSSEEDFKIGKLLYILGEKPEAIQSFREAIAKDSAKCQDAIDIIGLQDFLGDTSAYSGKQMSNLLGKELENNKFSIHLLNLSAQKLSNEEVSLLIQDVLEKEKIAVIPIELANNKWVGMVIKMQANGGLQVIYADPTGLNHNKEKNVRSLIKQINESASAKVESFNIISLQTAHKTNLYDFGPFTVENLTALAKTNTVTEQTAKASTVAKAVSAKTACGIDHIRIKHKILEDNNPWYGRDKIEALLKLQLDPKNHYILPVDLANEKIPVEKIKTAIGKLPHGNSSIVMPLYLDDHKIAGIIVKRGESGINIISVKTSNPDQDQDITAGIVSIMKILNEINPEGTRTCINKAQQTKDDAGVFIVEDLKNLATKNTNNIGKALVQKLLPNSEQSLDIQKQHIKLLQGSGIPVPSIEENDGEGSSATNSIIVVDLSTTEVNLFDVNIATDVLNVEPSLNLVQQDLTKVLGTTDNDGTYWDLYNNQDHTG